MLEKINYDKVDPVSKWAQLFIKVAILKFTFSLKKKELRTLRSLVWSTYFIKL